MWASFHLVTSISIEIDNLKWILHLWPNIIILLQPEFGCGQITFSKTFLRVLGLGRRKSLRKNHMEKSSSVFASLTVPNMMHSVRELKYLKYLTMGTRNNRHLLTTELHLFNTTHYLCIISTVDKEPPKIDGRGWTAYLWDTFTDIFILKTTLYWAHSCWGISKQ